MSIKITNYYQYALSASRTLNKKTQEEDVAHMGLGVMTEYFELLKALRNKDIPNIGEEYGDMNWYLANHCLMFIDKNSKFWKTMDQISFSNPQLSILSENEIILSIEILVEKYGDMCKRHFAYGKKINNYNSELENICLSINSFFSSLLAMYGLQPKNFLEKNINKLFIRYPEKFDSHLAFNRDLESERKELEK